MRPLRTERSVVLLVVIWSLLLLGLLWLQVEATFLTEPCSVVRCEE